MVILQTYSIPKLIVLENYKKILSKVLYLKNKGEHFGIEKSKVLLKIYDEGQKYFGLLNTYEDTENTNNFNFSLYIKSYIPQFNDISENKISENLTYLYENKFYVEFKIYVEEILGFDSLESDYQKKYVDVLDYLELSNDSINALNYLITTFPSEPYFLYLISRTYYKIDQFEKAYNFIKLYLRKELSTKALHLAGQTCRKLFYFKDACKYYELIQQKKSDDYAALTNLGALYEIRGMFQESIALDCQIIKSSDDEGFINNAKWNLSLLLIKLGRLKIGYRYYEYRKKLPYWNRFFKPNFLAEIPKFTNVKSKKILVTFEQGLGDTIQFMRYVHFLSSRVKEIDLLIQPVLIPIFNKSYFKNVNFIEKVAKEDKYDFWVSLLSIPYRLRIYDYPQLEKLAFNSKMQTNTKNETPNIGLCWRGSKSHTSDSFRSINIKDFEDLFNLNANFCILQIDLSQKESAYLNSLNKNIDTSLNKTNSFLKTAESINKLDVVISVDTSILHLSASLFIDTFGLLAKKSDYRWGLSDTPNSLYKTIKLIRQKEHFKWDDEIKRVKVEIEKKFNL